MISSIVFADREEHGAQRARVTLHSGEELQLERTGDLGERNAGMLIFVDGRERPEYVPWSDVERVDFDRPPAISPTMSPSMAGRKVLGSHRTSFGAMSGRDWGARQDHPQGLVLEDP